MKLTVDRSELWRGIDTVLDAVASKPAQPLLSNLLIEAEGDRLTLSASDLDLSMRTSVSAAVAVPGRTTVSARTLAEIVREWPEAELSVVIEDGQLVLSGSLGTGGGSGEGRYSLAVASPEGFPEIPESVEGVSIRFESGSDLDSQLIRTMIDKTSFAVSKDETRPVLNGVLWGIGPEGMAMVATDGSRLAEFRQSGVFFEGGGTTEVILPPQLCSQLSKLLEGPEELISATLGNSRVLFDLGHTQILSRLIEGPYVDYGQVVPKGNENKLTVDVERLLPAMRRVSILSSSYTHQVRMSLSRDNVELTASSQEVGGEAREILPATYAGDALEVAYNSQFFIDILRKLESGEAEMELKDTATAAIVRPAQQSEGQELYYLLMPMRPGG